MSNLCNLTVAGNLTRDPDLKDLGQGRVVLEFTVANTRWDKRAKEEYTTFYRVTVWNEYLQQRILARACKGTGVVVVGEYDPVPKGDGSGAVWHNIERPSVEFGVRQKPRQPSVPTQDDSPRHATTIDNDDDIPF
jgi:hypothetical protein